MAKGHWRTKKTSCAFCGVGSNPTTENPLLYRVVEYKQATYLCIKCIERNGLTAA